MGPTLGQEIRRLRTEAGITLRKFAETMEISAAYQSDIEHDRRRPPPPLLKRMVDALKEVGASLPELSKLDTRIDPDVRAWADATPGVRDMLRRMRDTGKDPREILRRLEEEEQRKKKKGK